MRAPTRVLLVLIASIAATPAIAAEQKFPAPLEAALRESSEAVVTDPQAALASIAKAEKVARTLHDDRVRRLALAKVRWLGAEAWLRRNQPERASPLLADGLRLIATIPEPVELRGDLLNTRGVLYMQRDQAEQALVSFQQAYRVFGQVRQPRRQAVALQNIASLYKAANDFVRAEHYYRQAAQTYTGDRSLSLSLHNNLGNVLMSEKRFADAEAEYSKAIETARDMDSSVDEARVLVNLARSQLSQKAFDATGDTLKRAFALIHGEETPMLRRHLLSTAAGLAADQGDYVRAARLIRQCFEGVDLETTGADYRNAHVYAHEIFSKVGQPALALKHLEALKRLSDDAATVATTTSASLLAAQFDYKNQELKISTLQREEAVRTAQFQRTLFLSIGGATLVIIVLLSFGLIAIRRSRNQVRAANVVLGDTNVALEKALKAKTEFLATTSHEIRTPLNGILGMTQVMLADPKLASDMRDRLGIVHGAGVTMRSLVDDILDVAKMETGNLTVDAAPMDLCATLKEVTRLWEEQARAKGLAFSLELSHAPQWIVGDAGRLRQIVFNLLSNAIKFTERGGVTVRAVEEGEGDARRLKLSVRDTGIGIPDDKFEEVFESFRQVDTSTTRQFGGTGLGLTICRNLARALGGEIRVSSVAGQGSTFTVDLPLVPAAAPADSQLPAQAGGTMLIVDRNPIARSMLRTLFEPRVGELRFVSDPAEALSALEAGGVAHLLIDQATLTAGSDDPLETLRALAAAGNNVPSAVLWIQPDADIKSQLLATGIGQVVEKPITGAALIDAVIPASQKNSGTGDAEPLVSNAA